MNGGGFGSMPKSLTCYICGRGYGTRSLKIHLKNCEIKWEHDQELKPKNQRRPCPQPPRGLMEVKRLSKTSYSPSQRLQIRT